MCTYRWLALRSPRDRLRRPIADPPPDALDGLPEHRAENHQQHTGDKEQRTEQHAQQFHTPHLLGRVPNGRTLNLSVIRYT